MHSRLRQDLRYVRLDAGTVFFDLERDRYFMATGRLADDFEAWLKEQATPEACERLLSRDILVPSRGWLPRGTEALRPTSSSLLDTPLIASSPLLVAEAVLSQHRAKRLLAKRPLKAILKTMQKSAMGCDDQDDALYARVAAAFQSARRLVRFEDQCLPRSLAMMVMLLRRGAHAQLVIGVREPFEAHCWVEHRFQALTDRIDELRPYSPIYRTHSL